MRAGIAILITLAGRYLIVWWFLALCSWRRRLLAATATCVDDDDDDDDNDDEQREASSQPQRNICLHCTQHAKSLLSFALKSIIKTYIRDRIKMPTKLDNSTEISQSEAYYIASFVASTYQRDRHLHLSKFA